MNEIGSASAQFNILDHVPVGAFVLRDDLVVLFWNRCLEDWTNVLGHQIVGANIGNYFPHLNEPKYLSRLQNIFEGGPPTIFSSQLHKFIIPAYLPNGQPRIQHTTVVAVNNPANTGFYALVVIQDVTDLTNRLHDYRTIRDQLQAYTVDLERSNRELENFAYIASHDLQEPLRKIQLFSHRLHTRYAGSLNEQALDYLHRMLNAATRMQDLIEDLLTYSRVTTRAHPFEQVDLNRIASEVLTDLEGRIEESGGQITVGLLPTIEADAVQMRQLLQNLIGNSLKYHQPGKPPLVKIRAKINNGWCELTIEDNGIGFDEKNLERIFHVFERLHGRGKYEGTGIGLAICRKIVVDRHRGNITARSTPGEGTTFMVTLPVQQAQSPATTATRSKHAAGP